MRRLIYLIPFCLACVAKEEPKPVVVFASPAAKSIFAPLPTPLTDRKPMGSIQNFWKSCVRLFKQDDYLEQRCEDIHGRSWIVIRCKYNYSQKCEAPSDEE